MDREKRRQSERVTRRCWSRIVSTMVMLGLGATVLSSQTMPVPVSPGAGGAEELTAEACPTFHWGEAADAGGYEILGYRLDGTDLSEAREIQSTGRGPDTPVLHEILPSGVGSWTPSLERCLEAGGHYAWTVREVQDKRMGAGAWAAPLSSSVPEHSPLERLLGRVVSRMLDEGDLTVEDVKQLEAWGLRGTISRTASDSNIDQGVQVLEVKAPDLPQIVEGAAAVSAALNVDGVGFNTGIYGEADLYGVRGKGAGMTGNNYGVFGTSESPDGRGVYGSATSDAGQGWGDYGWSKGVSGRGVFGTATANSGMNYGVYGESASVVGTGVYGLASGLGGINAGVHGTSASAVGRGVLGQTTHLTGGTIAVQGGNGSPSGWGFYASGIGTDYGPFTGGHEVRALLAVIYTSG